MKTLSKHKLIVFWVGSLTSFITVIWIGLFLFGQLDRFSNGNFAIPQIFVSLHENSNEIAKVINHDKVIHLKIKQDIGHIQLLFDPNQGQTDPQMRFLAPVSHFSLYLSPAEALNAQKKLEDSKLGILKPSAKVLEHSSKVPDVLCLRILGGNRRVAFVKIEKVERKGNLVFGSLLVGGHTHLSRDGKTGEKEQTPG